MESAYERAKAVLLENRETLDRIAKILLERETLERDEFEELMKGVTTSLAPADAPPKVVEKRPDEPRPDTAPGKSPILDPGQSLVPSQTSLFLASRHLLSMTQHILVLLHG